MDIIDNILDSIGHAFATVVILIVMTIRALVCFWPVTLPLAAIAALLYWL